MGTWNLLGKTVKSRRTQWPIKSNYGQSTMTKHDFIKLLLVRKNVVDGKTELQQIAAPPRKRWSLFLLPLNLLWIECAGRDTVWVLELGTLEALRPLPSSPWNAPLPNKKAQARQANEERWHGKRSLADPGHQGPNMGVSSSCTRMSWGRIQSVELQELK